MLAINFVQDSPTSVVLRKTEMQKSLRVPKHLFNVICIQKSLEMNVISCLLNTSSQVNLNYHFILHVHNYEKKTFIL